MGNIHRKADAGSETVRTLRRGGGKKPRPDEEVAGMVLALQRAAGNRAVSGLIGSAPLQRRTKWTCSEHPRRSW